jgi:predicted RNase H-like HicB family nuclease
MAEHAMTLTTRYDGMVVATFPDLPGVSALGVDDEDARREGLRALGEALAEKEKAEPPLAMA